jgi:hypothetical protein
VELDRLEQLVEVVLLRRGDVDLMRVAAQARPPRSRAGELLPHLVGFARLGLSILLIATITGTSAALAWLIASIVCGITPSSAATTSTTMSVTSRLGRASP